MLWFGGPKLDMVIGTIWHRFTLAMASPFTLTVWFGAYKWIAFDVTLLSG